MVLCSSFTGPHALASLPMEQLFRLHIIALFILASLLCCANHGLAEQSSNSIRLQLRWHHQFQFAGYYAAIAKGYYEEEGISVQLIEGGAGIHTIDQVLADHAEYGVTNSEVLLQRLQGKPLLVLAAIFQHSPLVMIARQDAGIFSPQDLTGKRVVLSRSSRDLELLATLQVEGVPLESMRIIDRLAAREDYFDPSIDAISAYITNQPFYYALNKIPHSIIHPSSYGIDFYGDCLFTTEKEVLANPKRVAAFRRASLKGWAYAMAHPEEIINLIKRTYTTEKTPLHLQYEAEKMKQLIQPEIIEIGHMNPGRWQHIAQIFAGQGMVETPVTLNGFFYTDYLNKDGPEAYLPTLTGVIMFVGGSLVFTVCALNILLRQKRRQKALEQELAATRSKNEKHGLVLHSLADFLQASGNCANLALLCQKVCASLTNITEADTTALFQFDTQARAMHIVAACGSNARNLRTYITYDSIGEEQAALIRLASFQMSKHIFAVPGPLAHILRNSERHDRQTAILNTQESEPKPAGTFLVFIPGTGKRLLGMLFLLCSESAPSLSPDDIALLEAHSLLFGRILEQSNNQTTAN